MKLVFDTSILIDYLRGGNRWNDFLETVDKDNTELYLPTIVAFELFSGKSSSDSYVIKKILDITKLFQLLDLSWDIGEKASEIYRDFISNLEVPDYIIAATTLEIGGTIVTLNRKHFEKIPGLSIYPL
ncbi:MAG: hypothetical protein US60_C0032G0007 [Microgenomates group bacterium GW2011_GWC1_37_8]|uniref:PIN domain-containing protein n=1 Tax=Candidatus Woesebacteria bacterium GW2011_GWB1_38_8 TaxID=1618570 RepID=A0A0G0NH54_9BACT|nr:MAG: hypothetical protein US60_C0032G0007 [Microgenomates group bacterium GW2011_GWC1_37_8]KKQ85214.1 MAG: hypothetical protein UT08_C0009G0048 [Candidatus Woesebacteria bacterium GW2011_GWB1_38_8]